MDWKPPGKRILRTDPGLERDAQNLIAKTRNDKAIARPNGPTFGGQVRNDGIDRRRPKALLAATTAAACVLYLSGAYLHGRGFKLPSFKEIQRALTMRPATTPHLIRPRLEPSGPSAPSLDQI